MSLFTQNLLVTSASFNIKFQLLVNNYHDCLILAPAHFGSPFSPPTLVFLCFFQHLSAFSCFGAFLGLHLHDSYVSALFTTPFPVLLFNRSVVPNSLWPHGLQHARLLCPSPSPVACSNYCLLSQWCHPTISSLLFSSSPAFYLSQHEGLFQWLSYSHQVAEVLDLQLQNQSFQWIFRTDFL